MVTQHITALAGKTGRIYTARNGTVMAFVLDTGEEFIANCLNPSMAMVKTVPQYWRGAIDWAAADYEYKVFGMTKDPEDKPHYPAARTIEEQHADRNPR